VLQATPTFPGSPPRSSAQQASVLPQWQLSEQLRERVIYALLAATLVLNLLDAIFTLFAVRAGIAVETNPLMQELLSRGPMSFMLGKVVMVSLGILVLWRLRWLGMAVVGSVAAFVTYALICIWHIHGLTA
jgi:hypothetical protein